MSSMIFNSDKANSELLQLSLNDSTLDLLNAAIASHQVKVEDTMPTDSSVLHKREREKDSTPKTTPKRAGRKPLDNSQIPDATSDPKQKRKAQNRAAQRAFRDRKEKYVSELQARIDELEAINATKDEELVKENSRLKEMLKKLQEENYALKGAKFTFEYPQPSHKEANSELSHFFSSGSYSEDSSAEHSPLSNSHTHEDDSTSSDTPNTANTLFTADPIQFGLIPPTTTSNLDFLAVNDVIGLNNDALPTADLFHGKDDLFSSFLPSNLTTDDFLFTQGNDLINQLGATDNLFSFNNMNTQFSLPETPMTNSTKEKKQPFTDKSNQAEYQGAKQSCPGFDLDLLCDELKMKAQCSGRGPHPFSEKDVNAFLNCINKH